MVIFPTAQLKNVRVFLKKGTVGRMTGNENIIDSSPRYTQNRQSMNNLNKFKSLKLPNKQ